MPLLKLWNAIRGRSHSEQAAPTAAGGGQPTAKTAAAQPSAPATTPTKSEPPKPKRPSPLNIFGSASPHAGLCKLVKSLSVKSMLEIGVDDGSRAIAILETLSKNLPSRAPAEGDAISPPVQDAIRYIVIDQFEMAGGTTTLRRFHQTMRGAEIRPQVFPEPIDRGLTRVAHTVGAVDLILIAADLEQWQTPAITALLSRISHPNTKIVYRDGEVWQPFAPSESGLRRVA